MAAFRPRTFLLLAWAVNVCINAFYIAPSPVFPEMIGQLGISNAQAGALISFYLLAILLFQLPSGFVMDRVDPRKMIPVASVAVLGLSAAMCLVPRYDAILVFRILAGIPVAFIFAPSAFLVSRAFAKTPGRAVGLFLSAPPAGVAVGNLLAHPLAIAAGGGSAANGWPFVFVAFNVPLLVLAPLLLVASRHLPAREHERFGVRDFLAAFRNRELWKVGLAFACSYAAYIFYSSWTPTYLGIAAPALGAVAIGVVSSLIPAAGIASRPFGGHLAETRFRADKRRVPMIGFALLVGTSLAIPFLGLAAIPFLIASGFLAQFPFSVYYLFSSEILPPKFRGTAYAYNNTISIIGGAISPVSAGFLADVTGSFLAAFVMIAATAALGFLILSRLRAR